MNASFPTARLPQQMLTFFAERVARGQSLALVTVLSTSGSSYSKAGHQLLVDDAGDFQGILSGGCLEGDLVERSARAIEMGVADTVEYDLSADDELFGLGVGCEGAMQVLIQPLTADTGFEPLATAMNSLENSGIADIHVTLENAAYQFRWLAPARILVLGAGPDVDPLLQICKSLGWQVTVYDHRPAYIDRLHGSGSLTVECFPAGELDQRVNVSRFDAAIVMSHNLASDRAYLQQLARSRLDFVGLLGPPHRRDRLLHDLGSDAGVLAGRLRSPVGKQIGGRGPGAIALEVVVELQEYFCELDQHLSSASRSAGVSISIAAGSKSTTATA